METNNLNFNNDLKSLKENKLSDFSKDRIFSNINNYTLENKVNSKIKSNLFFGSNIFIQKPFFVAFLLIIILLGSGTVFASEKSLPGDFLYNLKTKIIEPFIGLIKTSEQSKANFNLSLADKRLQEIDSVIETKSLDDDSKQNNLMLFYKHLENYKKYSLKTEILTVESNINIRSAQYQKLISADSELKNFYNSSVEASLNKNKLDIKNLIKFENSTSTNVDNGNYLNFSEVEKPLILENNPISVPVDIRQNVPILPKSSEIKNIEININGL